MQTYSIVGSLLRIGVKDSNNIISYNYYFEGKHFLAAPQAYTITGNVNYLYASPYYLDIWFNGKQLNLPENCNSFTQINANYILIGSANASPSGATVNQSILNADGTTAIPDIYRHGTPKITYCNDFVFAAYALSGNNMKGFYAYSPNTGLHWYNASTLLETF
jgi:hypothetical protein